MDNVVDKHGKSVTITKRKSEKQEIELNKRATEAFEKLKVCLTTTSEDEPELGVLIMPNFNKPLSYTQMLVTLDLAQF